VCTGDQLSLGKQSRVVLAAQMIKQFGERKVTKPRVAWHALQEVFRSEKGLSRRRLKIFLEFTYVDNRRQASKVGEAFGDESGANKRPRLV
jgi:hypothetical protein